ncbi:MAG: ribulokinase [Phycisphaerales bacterium]|nr:ribulokinase [Phycisphaerales bacterium]
MPATPTFSLGLDFGTNSARALLVDLRSGEEVASAVAPYPSGTQGVLLDPRDPLLARQSPADWAAALTRAVRAAVRMGNRHKAFRPEGIIGIGIDTTGSTPLPVDATSRALALRPEFAKNLHAAAWLWKDHTSHAEAEEITELLRLEAPEYLLLCGGAYSSEWFWSKILHCLRTAPRVFAAAASWLEQCDYIPALLTGCDDVRKLPRSICAAGHKAMFHPKLGLPPAELLGRLDPRLADLRTRLYNQAFTADQVAGTLAPDWARRLGLPAGIPIAVGAIDAHLGAVGAGIRPGTLVKIIGTSSCDMMITEQGGRTPEIPGLCGYADGSIVPAYWGIEAGQSAVGDLFHWFVHHFDRRRDGHAALSREAATLRPGESGLLALDWNNGNRCTLVDVRLTGLLVGQTLHTTPAETYRALIEATAFGARAIMERLEEYGVQVREVVNCGGIADKNPLIMQIYADVTGRPMKIARSSQACALGAAICGAVAAGKRRGGFASFAQAQKKLTGTRPTVYRPERRAHTVYNELYGLYRRLYDAFGNTDHAQPVGDLMKELLVIRDCVRQRV